MVTHTLTHRTMGSQVNERESLNYYENYDEKEIELMFMVSSTIKPGRKISTKDKFSLLLLLSSSMSSSCCSTVVKVTLKARKWKRNRQQTGKTDNVIVI